ncbi:MAG: GNAT family N-acetyltransferase [Patescibacteria group bacterium]
MFYVTPQTITYRNASLTYALIPWDSKYLQNTTIEIKEFAFKSKQTAKNLLLKLKKNLNLTKGDLLFLKTSPLEVERLHVLTSSGFYVIEEAVEISFDLTNWNPKSFPQHQNRQYQLVPALPKHLPELRKIAGKAFIADRYHLDKNISSRGSNSRFVGWVESSLKGSDEVFAFIDDKGVVAGFFIIANKQEGTNLRLAAIDPKLVGKGLGKLLYFSLFSWLKKRGRTTIQTQISLNNTAVFNVYTYLVHPKVTRLDVVLHYVI